MAENNKVDQGKVKEGADKLAGGKAPDPQPENVPAAAPAPIQQAPAPTKEPDPIPEKEATASIAKAAKDFGPGSVRARKGDQETVFSARAWDLLGDNKEGWKPVTQKPKEVQDLEAKKASDETKK